MSVLDWINQLQPEQLLRAEEILRERSLTFEDLDEAAAEMLVKRVLNENATWFYRAHVEVTLGDRRLCEMMRCAGLGITGVGYPHDFVYEYAPGVEVDEARVDTMMRKVKADCEQTDMVILSHKLKYLEKVER